MTIVREMREEDADAIRTVEAMLSARGGSN